MRARRFVPSFSALPCALIAGASFAQLVPMVRAAEAPTLFASSFGAGASLTAAFVQVRRKRPD
jgi:hypothetical protein